MGLASGTSEQKLRVFVCEPCSEALLVASEVSWEQTQKEADFHTAFQGAKLYISLFRAIGCINPENVTVKIKSNVNSQKIYFYVAGCID